MQKKTETRIEELFIDSIKKKRLEEIDVTYLCKKLNIKRQTFYYHFESIIDVIYSIYYQKKIEIPTKVDNFYNNLLDNIIKFLYIDKEFNYKIIESSAKEVINEFLFSYLYKGLQLFLNNYKLNLDQNRELARFIARSLVEQILYFFEHRDYSYLELENKILLFMNEDIIQYIINKF